MAPITKAHLNMASSTETANCHSPMEILIQGSSKTESSMAMESLLGQTVTPTKECTQRDSEMDMEF